MEKQLIQDQKIELENIISKKEQELTEEGSDKVATTVELANALVSLSKLEEDLHRKAILQQRASDLYDSASKNDPTKTNKLANASCVFRVSPPGASYRMMEDDEMNEEDDETDESSEDEDFDHSEHFYQLAKQQYEEILLREPNNADIRKKLTVLVDAHNFPNKKQRTK
jgi:hypothetical protein